MPADPSLVSAAKRELTDGLNDHGVHFVWAKLELVSGQAGEGTENKMNVKKTL